MPKKKDASGICLPSSLLERLDNSESDGHHTHSRPRNARPSRKELRKLGRTEKRHRKAEHFAHHGRSEPVEARPATLQAAGPESHGSRLMRGGEGSQCTPNAKKRPAAEAESAAHVRKKARLSKPSEKSANTPPTATSKKLTPAVGTKRTRVEALTVLPDASTHQEEEEDSYIEYLEAQLGYSRIASKKRQDRGEDDGLDDLLDFTSSMSVMKKPSRGREHQIVDDDDVEEDLDEEPSGEEGLSDNEKSYDEELSIQDDHDDIVSGGDGSTQGDESGVDEEEEWGGITQECEGVTALQEDASHAPTEPVQKPVRYVPPHLRKANGTDSEALLRLKKQLKGLLNRMSEPNLATILDSVDEVYRSHSRHDVTSTLTSLLIEGVSSHSLLLDSYVVLHAAFISSLHKTVGAEFASYLIQHVVSSYEHAYKSTREGAAASDQVPTLSKESTSLIMLLAELYNFQVISCVLIYDIIRELLDGDITELDVELLLKVVRGAGSRLRQDDPLALKDIIRIVQQKVSEKTEAPSSRTRFMIETLTNLKNNKLKRSATQGQGGNEAVERLRKFLSALHKKRHVLSHDPLRLTLDDLRTAETRGRWWLPGAPWVGDPLAERQAECRANAKQEGSDPTQEQQDVDHALLRLAKKQGMNTDIRRSIFVVLMSSEDYVDACDRLSQLGLTEVQQREIVRVLLHCCGNEKVYNPYYALVGQHLCRTSHAPKVTIQFCLWDFLRELGESGVGGLAVLKSLEESQGLDGSDDFDTDGKISQTRVDNIARLYAWWIAKDSVALTMFKPLDFAMLKPRAKSFLKCLLVHVFRSVQAAGPAYDVGPSLSGGGTDAGWSGDAQRSRGAIEDVFIKATRSETLAVGLLYFIKDAFREETDGFVRWACKVACDALGTAV